MNDSDRRSDLFRRMRCPRSSAMGLGIAVVVLPRLDERSLSLFLSRIPCLGRVSVNNSG